MVRRTRRQRRTGVYRAPFLDEQNNCVATSLFGSKKALSAREAPCTSCQAQQHAIEGLDGRITPDGDTRAALRVTATTTTIADADTPAQWPTMTTVANDGCAG
jgi:hypothetical protein